MSNQSTPPSPFSDSFLESYSNGALCYPLPPHEGKALCEELLMRRRAMSDVKLTGKEAEYLKAISGGVK